MPHAPSVHQQASTQQSPALAHTEATALVPRCSAEQQFRDPAGSRGMTQQERDAWCARHAEQPAPGWRRCWLETRRKKEHALSRGFSEPVGLQARKEEKERVRLQAWITGAGGIAGLPTRVIWVLHLQRQEARRRLLGGPRHVLGILFQDLHSTAARNLWRALEALLLLACAAQWLALRSKLHCGGLPAPPAWHSPAGHLADRGHVEGDVLQAGSR